MTQQPGGGYPPPQAPGPQPSSHLVFAILVTIFCCLPFGIVSIVKASQVSGLWAQGRYAEAQQSSASARKWAMWGAIIGLITIVIYAILYATNTIAFENNTS
jgi:Interferon-induced transmembrane protein